MITEPATLATDYALALLSAWFASRLLRRGAHLPQLSVRLWALAFVATAIGSFAGGTYHGFRTVLAPAVAAGIWTVATIAIGVAACLLVSGALLATFTGSVRRWLLVLVWAQLAVYVGWMLRHDDFVYVIVEYGAAMLAVLCLQLFTKAGRSSAARGWIVGGVCATMAAAAVQQSGVALHQHLNHNDLQHLVQMFALWLLYRGGERLEDVVPERLARGRELQVQSGGSSE